MNKTLKKIAYVWAVIMAVLIITLFLVGCGAPQQYPYESGDVYFHDPHYEPSDHIPPPPEIDLDTLIEQATDPRYHFPE